MLPCGSSALVIEVHRMFEGDDEEELDVEFDGVVVSEYFASVLQQSPDRPIFILDLSTLVELDLFSTTTTVS